MSYTILDCKLCMMLFKLVYNYHSAVKAMDTFDMAKLIFIYVSGDLE